jgi:hypothetical protein
MYSIVGAILIHAACLLMATEKDTFDVYAGQRLLAMVGAAFIGGDLAHAWRNRRKPTHGAAP